jgi:tRNA1(Val) A37 N6-methylase TrmN6
MNPPFNAPHNPSPDRARRLARAALPDAPRQWIDAAARLLRPDGALTLIWRADGLADVLAALTAGFGAIAIMPVYPKPGTAAIRVLMRATKNSYAPLVLLPGLILTEADNKPSAQAEAILRAGAALALARPDLRY